jgi:hypothetical protein
MMGPINDHFWHPMSGQRRRFAIVRAKSCSKAF